MAVAVAVGPVVTTAAAGAKPAAAPFLALEGGWKGGRCLLPTEQPPSTQRQRSQQSQ